MSVKVLCVHGCKGAIMLSLLQERRRVRRRDGQAAAVDSGGGSTCLDNFTQVAFSQHTNMKCIAASTEVEQAQADVTALLGQYCSAVRSCVGWFQRTTRKCAQNCCASIKYSGGSILLSAPFCFPYNDVLR